VYGGKHRPVHSVNVADPFALQELRIRQPGKVMPGRARYEIFDPSKNLLAVATETERRSRMDTITGMVPGRRALEVRTAAGEPLLTLVNRETQWCAEVVGPDGELIGKIQIGDSRRDYTLIDHEDQIIGQAVGNLAVKQFAVTGANGERYAQIRKTWAGVRKEFFTDADHYSVTFTGPAPARVRMLIVMVTIVLDMSRYGPY
jgi:hypothetical protein